MIPLRSYKAATVGVLGLGPNGMAAAEAMRQSGATVLAWDSRPEAQSSYGDEVVHPDDWPFDRLSTVILADGQRGGISNDVVKAATNAGCRVQTDLDLFAEGLAAMPEEQHPTVIAVSGAAGKSLTVAIIAHILKEYGRDVVVGGHIGSPFLAMREPRRGTVYVLEMPVRRLVTTQKLHCDISVVLNVLGSGGTDQMELALRSLMRIFRGQRKNDRAVIGVDDAVGQKICTLMRSGQLDIASAGSVIPVSGEASLGHGVFAIDGKACAVLRHKTQVIGDFSRAPAFSGEHFNQDAAAAIAVSLGLNIPPAAIMTALHSFTGLPGRFEALGTAGPIMFVDDSYGSSATAVRRAIKSCPDVIWIGGRVDTGGRPLDQAGDLMSLQAAHLVDAPDTSKILPEDVATRQHATLEAAMKAALLDAETLMATDSGAAPVILYSPGITLDFNPNRSTPFRDLVGRYMEKAPRYA